MESGSAEMPDELEIIHRASGGDHDAFRSLVQAYEARLLTYLFHMLEDKESARDIAQETFVAAFFALPQWVPSVRSSVDRKISSTRSVMEMQLLAPWLYRIATNRALNFIKRRPVSMHLSESEAGEHSTKLLAYEMALEDRYAIRELLHEALSRLPAEDAACLVLRFVAGESYNEIGERLGITKEAARKRITRGLSVLRSVYSALDMEVLT